MRGLKALGIKRESRKGLGRFEVGHGSKKKNLWIVRNASLTLVRRNPSPSVRERSYPLSYSDCLGRFPHHQRQLSETNPPKCMQRTWVHGSYAKG
ncbi:hypothetical protein SESBI_06543 [Sesbania bispinosa]|nr:hypothetical protein SESBI_06543 [Sesbania bispinosa]